MISEVLEEQVFTTTDPQKVAISALIGKAKTAINANATFMAIPAPTQAQTLAHVKVMTRELNALIKLVVGLYGGHLILEIGTDT